MKRFAFLLLLLVSMTGYAQNTINNYKYVLVPQRFSFAKDDDQYGLNTLAKSMLERKGFTVFINNGSVPQEIAGNHCLALTAEVTQKKGMFVTNLTLLLKDCQGNVVFKGKEGKSWEKEYVVAYNEALKEAFKSLDTTAYVYNGGNGAVQPGVAAAPVAPAVSAPVAAAPASAVPATATTAAPAAVSENETVLYAQATATGYQLIDTKPQIVLTLYRTSASDYYIADGAEAHGILLKQGGEWYFEYYKAAQLVREKLAIKF